MIRFRGRSNQTHRIKNKPIKEGYKFFVLACAWTGFILNFTPTGMNPGKHTNLNEYDTKGKEGKIMPMLMYLIDTLLTSAKNGRKFILCMDNYFTLPKVMKKLRELGIGCVGTARARTGWPPAELSKTHINDVTDNNVTFNQLYWTIDKFGTLVSRWMDNNFVLIVSTIHDVAGSIAKNRRRPKVTMKNKGHVDKVWGTEGKFICFILFILYVFNSNLTLSFNNRKS